ncbi:hydantoinase/oxoprolinase family protein [Pelomicrobium sp. G1]|uniref:hydantoinase/oxoprolinase family protein n=1 Tax=unclassified Pelomicrobium TaxID=2815318 RepID=UPI003F766BDC
MPEAAVIGWDLGGAHLKAAAVARTAGELAVLDAVQLPCPLWRGLDYLAAAVDRALERLGAAPCHALTMTGEMADLFRDRAEGVARLADFMERRLSGRRTRYFAGVGFVDAAHAKGMPRRVASANWLASARFVAGRLEAALFVDVGSTTTDLVPVAGGEVRAAGEDDFERLASGELVYTGVARTPVMALGRRVPFEGRRVPLVAEHFATMADVHRLAGALPEHADQWPAADGGEKTEEGSARRLARMIGRDAASAAPAAWRRLARRLAGYQLAQIEAAARRVLAAAGVEATAPVVGAGVGRFVAARLAARLERPYRDFAGLFHRIRADPEWVAGCAPAVAVACLAAEEAEEAIHVGS